MVRIAWRMMRERPAGLVATFVALWVAVVIVTACGVMLESGVRFHGRVDRYAAAPVLVAATEIRETHGHGDSRSTDSRPLPIRGRLPAGLDERIAAAPGVRAAVSDVSVPVRMVAGDRAAVAEAHPWRAAALAPFTLRAGSAPAAGGVVLDPSVAAGLQVRTGDHVQLDTAAGGRTVTVTGIAAAAGVGATVFTTDAEAARISLAEEQVIGVLPEPGVHPDVLAKAVRAALPRLPDQPAGAFPQVFTGTDRGSVESTDVEDGRESAIAVSSVFGGCALLIAVLVIAGTVGLSVRQRQRDMALLRAIAATPRQVRRIVVRETTALALLAGGTGVWAGLALAAWLRSQFVSRGMVPSSFMTYVSWLPPLVATGAALIIAVVASWIASLRASRLRPTAALTETAVERDGIGVIRSLLGLIALAGGITLCVVSSQVTGDNAAGISVATVFTMTVAVALLSPVLIRVAVATFGRALLAFGVTGRLAAATTRTSARRLSGVLSVLVLSVALGGSLWFVETSVEHTAKQQAHAGLRADYVVTSPAPGLGLGTAARLGRLPEVKASAAVAQGTLFASSGDVTDYRVQGVDPRGFARTVDLGVTGGSLDALRGNTVAVDALTARTLDLHIDDHFTGWFGDGAPARLRVVAIYTRGLGFAPFTVPVDTLLPHTASGLVETVFLRDDGSGGLARDVGRLAPGSAVLDRAAYQVSLDEDVVQNGWTNKMVISVLLIYVGIAAVNSLIMYALDRRREFAVLRLSGMTPRQVMRMVRQEQGFLLGLALALGVGIAAATLVPMVKGLTGSPSPYIPLLGWAAVIGGVVLLGFAAAVPPARRALRIRPVDAAGERQ